MRLALRIAAEARKRWALLAIAMASHLVVTCVNLVAPQLLADMVDIVSARSEAVGAAMGAAGAASVPAASGADAIAGSAAAAMEGIVRLAMLLLALFAARVVFRFMASYLAHRAAWLLVQDIRQRLYDHIQKFSMGFFRDRQTGDLMSRVVNDTSTFEALFAHIIPELAVNAVTMACVTAILFATNARLAALTCLPLPFVLLSGWVFTKKVKPRFSATQKSLADVNSQLHDNFGGIMEIQAFCGQGRESVNVEHRLSAFTRNMLVALKLSAAFHPSVEFLTSLGTVIVVGFGGYLSTQGMAGVSDIVAFMLYLSLFYGPVAGLAVLLENFSQSLAGAERVLETLDEKPDIVDAPLARPLPAVKGRVEFSGVCFAYEKDAPVLSDVSFVAEPGQMVAIVGPTGVGKSTAIQLVPRFFEPDAGRVLIDGFDVRDVTLESLRSQIAMVLQDTFLFSGTLEENIAYANPSEPRERIVEAAKAARIHDDIEAMRDGYATQAGERGVKLSGGQKQRIAIARAVLRDAPILILDEATASVDAETEREIQLAIEGQAGKRTIIAIAHRLSTIRRADQIIVLEGGRIVQRGTHNELAASDGPYRRLISAQQAGC